MCTTLARQRLNKADRQIAKAETAVTQLALIARLNADGHDTAEAARQLHDFENTLQSMREHRSNIVKLIDQVDERLA